MILEKNWKFINYRSLDFDIAISRKYSLLIIIIAACKLNLYTQLISVIYMTGSGEVMNLNMIDISPYFAFSLESLTYFAQRNVYFFLVPILLKYSASKIF